MIIECALSITRKEGIEAINARRIGKELNCSLQPVYYYFGTMNTLRNEVIKAANDIYNKCLKNTLNEIGNHFKSVGINYVRFATQEKELFKLLFMRSANLQSDYKVEVDDNTEEIVKEIIHEFQLSDSDARKLHFELWVATHGIASMIATEYMDFASDQISSMLDDYCVGIIMQMKGKKLHD